MKPERFLVTHAIFTRAELVAVLMDRGCAASTVDSHLARWHRQGRIARIKQGLFVRLDSPAGADGPLPDFIAIASRMAPDAAVAYHSALEVHGYAQSIFEKLTFVTWTKTKPLDFLGRRFTPVRPRTPLFETDRGARWIEHAERSGIEIRVTSLERTVADALDRPDLSGGVDEVWRSLLSVSALDLDLLEKYVTTLHSRTLAAKVGFFLESRSRELVVSGALLNRLRTMSPRGPVYLDRRRKGRFISDWGLVVPVELMGDPSGGTI